MFKCLAICVTLKGLVRWEIKDRSYAMSNLIVFMNFDAYDKSIFILLLNCFDKIEKYEYIYLLPHENRKSF